MSSFFSMLADKVSSTLGIDLQGVLSEKLYSLMTPETIQAIAKHAEASGLGEQVRSWIGNGENLPVSADELKNLLNSDEVQALVSKTGLPADTLMPALAKLLPDVIDKHTPSGELPSGQ